MTEFGVWVYAVCADTDGAMLGGARGVDGEAVRLVRGADLAAVVGTVDLATFGEDGLQRSLNDLEQLERIARAHHSVVGIAAEYGPVAPTRLATVYDDDDRVRGVLEHHAGAFRAALDEITGRHEWGLKAYAKDKHVEAEPSPRPASGSAYLRQRQAMLNARNASRQAAVAAADSIHERVAQLAVTARQHRPQDPQLTGDDRVMLLNGAYLVEDDAAERIRATVSALARDHGELDLQLTGPWPPYSFAIVNVEDPG
jgi:Gas vesicle synthesis protein GvpL/GvpF